MSLHGLFREEADEGRRPNVYEGIVVDSPGSESHGLRVRIPSFDGFGGKTVFGPCPWQPRYEVGNDVVEIVYPQPGDRALVVFSHDLEESGGADCWVSSYWPFDDPT